MTTLGARIRMVRNGLSRRVFAEKFGISSKTLQRYEEGGRLAPDELLLDIAGSFGVSVSWLSTGQGPMYSENLDQGKNLETKDSATEEGSAKDKLITCLESLAALQKENGDLRLEVERLRMRVAQREKDLAEVLKDRPGAWSMDSSATG